MTVRNSPSPFPAPTLTLATSTTTAHRAGAYEFLAGIFLKKPSPEILSELNAWAQTSGDSQIQSLLTKILKKDPCLENLEQEYYDLFFVPVSGRFVPPFESAITGALREEGKTTKFGSFWGTETVEIAHLYERTGFQPNQLVIFGPLRELNLLDHLGFELSFMAYLCRLQEEQENLGLAISGLQQLQKSVLTQHLNRCLPLFVKDLERVDQSGYYLYFAKLTQTLCEEEAAYWDDDTP